MIMEGKLLKIKSGAERDRTADLLNAMCSVLLPIAYQIFTNLY